jgi:hypothetical protein
MYKWRRYGFPCSIYSSLNRYTNLTVRPWWEEGRHEGNETITTIMYISYSTQDEI